MGLLGEAWSFSAPNGLHVSIRSFMEKRSEEENTIDNKENSSINNDVSSMEKGEGQIEEPSKDK